MSDDHATPAAPTPTQSPTLGALASALAAAQGTFEAASKDRANPYFGSRYATLASIWDVCRGGLSTNGLAVVQQVARTTGEVSVRTLLLHSSGEWVSSTITLPVVPLQRRDGTELKVTAQSYGSAITYGRRYGLAAVVGIAPDDDDGAAASGHVEVAGADSTSRRDAPLASPDKVAVATARRDALKARMREQLAGASGGVPLAPHARALEVGAAAGLDKDGTKAALALATGRAIARQGDVTEADVQALSAHLARNTKPPPMTEEEIASIEAAERGGAA